MYVLCVTIFVKEQFRENFIKATLDNAKNTRKEPLNLRFDAHQCLDDPNRFFLYEVYKDETGITAHKETAHYKKWRDLVEPMMAKPREGIKHKNLFPINEEAFLAK